MTEDVKVARWLFGCDKLTNQINLFLLGYLHIIDVSASNQFGKGLPSNPIYLQLNSTTPASLLDWAPVVGGGLAVLFLIVCGICGFCYLLCIRMYMARTRKNVFERSEKLADLDMKEVSPIFRDYKFDCR